jgi:hypothetical protein
VKRKPVNQPAYEYYRRHPNEQIYSSSVAHELGLHMGSVQTAVAKMARTPGSNLHSVNGDDGQRIRGLYVYKTSGKEFLNEQVPEMVSSEPAVPEFPVSVEGYPQYYEFVGVAEQSDYAIVRGENGRLYTLYVL